MPKDFNTGVKLILILVNPGPEIEKILTNARINFDQFKLYPGEHLVISY